MATNQRFTVKYRRKRAGRTNYRKRLHALAGGVPRLVVRKSLHHMQLQIIEYQPTGDRVLVSATTKELSKQGYKGATSNLPAAYLCGVLLAKKAKAKKVIHAVADIGFTTPVKGAVVFAAVAGARAGGLDVPADEKALPDKKRLHGEHVAAYAMLIKKDDALYKKMFAAYLRHGLAPETLPKHVQEVEAKLK